jgi:hypothetical protein
MIDHKFTFLTNFLIKKVYKNILLLLFILLLLKPWLESIAWRNFQKKKKKKKVHYFGDGTLFVGVCTNKLNK